MQMDASRQVAERTGCRGLYFLQNASASKREKMQRRADLAINRMLDGHVDQRATQIDDRIQLFTQALVPMMADDTAFRRPARRGFQISRAAWRARRAARAQQGHVAHDDLAADAALSGASAVVKPVRRTARSDG